MIICLQPANGGYMKIKKQTKMTIKLNISEKNKLLKCTKEIVQKEEKEDVSICCYGTCSHQ